MNRLSPRLPDSFEIARRLPPPEGSVREAEHYTRDLAGSHYENFHLASFLLPRRLRQPFFNVYAYCRWADDLGDEIADPKQAMELLRWWEEELRLCYAGTPRHAVFVALYPTIRGFQIPIDPFLDLLAAFRRDQVDRRYRTWDDLLEYCRFSADPVGRLVLYLCGHREPELQRLSDATCTALQLTNFWQDVARDLDKDRIYVPLDLLAARGLSESDLFGHRFDARYAELMRDLIERTRKLFVVGVPLAQRVAPELRVDIELFSRGGLAVLESIEAIGYDTLHRRPTLARTKRIGLLGRALAGRLRAALSPVRPPGVPASNRNA